MFFNDKTKEVRWWNRNYFFLTTLLVIGGIIAIYAFVGTKIYVGSPETYSWYEQINFSNYFQNFLNSFFHLSWGHVIGNSICFFLCGLYLERKVGSFPFLFLTILFAAVSSAFVGANNLSTNWVGLSCTIYALQGYIITDYFFSFAKSRRSKFNVIWGTIFLVFNVFSMCVITKGGTLFKVWEWEVGITLFQNLLYNGGHYTGLLSGLIIGLLLGFHAIYQRKCRNNSGI